ncbi:hypothetical protein PLESTM_000312800 [Pleodorina starrii]|nr:hypothetical protein PLESTM_000312800 [Pleodorina starrii]
MRASGPPAFSRSRPSARSKSLESRRGKVRSATTLPLRFHAALDRNSSSSSSFGSRLLSSGGSSGGSSSSGNNIGNCACPVAGPQLPAAATAAAHTLAAAATSVAEWAAAAVGDAERPGFDAVKMRFHLGKHLFRNLGAHAARAELSAAELQGAGGATGGGGRGAYQSVFSNYVPASAVPRVTSWLTGVLGFCLVASKTSATLHVINQELNVHYGIALAMGAAGHDSSASLRKVKVGGGKSHSVALLAAPHQMDLRLRLVAQSQSAQREQPGLSYSADARSTARRVAAAVCTEGFEGFLRSKRGLPRNRHLEYGRRKTKLVYEGRFPPPSSQQQQQGGGCCGGQLLRAAFPRSTLYCVKRCQTSSSSSSSSARHPHRRPSRPPVSCPSGAAAAAAVAAPPARRRPAPATSCRTGAAAAAAVAAVAPPTAGFTTALAAAPPPPPPPPPPPHPSPPPSPPSRRQLPAPTPGAA